MFADQRFFRYSKDGELRQHENETFDDIIEELFSPKIAKFILQRKPNSGVWLNKLPDDTASIWTPWHLIGFALLRNTLYEHMEAHDWIMTLEDNHRDNPEVTEGQKYCFKQLPLLNPYRIHLNNYAKHCESITNDHNGADNLRQEVEYVFHYLTQPGYSFPTQLLDFKN